MSANIPSQAGTPPQRRSNSAPSSIAVLPCEVLSEIFDWVVTGSQWEQEHGRKKLLEICKSWRRRGLNQASLWTNVYLTLKDFLAAAGESGSEESKINRHNNRVAKSGHLPFSLTIEIEHRHPSFASVRHNFGPPAQSHVKWSNRMKKLTWASQGHPRICHELTSLLSRNFTFPTLESYEVNDSFPETFDYREDDCQICQEDFGGETFNSPPSLPIPITKANRLINLVATEAKLLASSYSLLRDLNVLRLHNIWLDSWDQLKDILKEIPKLEEFELALADSHQPQAPPVVDGVVENANGNERERLQLPHLRKLSIRMCPGIGCAWLIQAIEAPVIEDLHFHLYRGRLVTSESLKNLEESLTKFVRLRVVPYTWYLNPTLTMIA